MMGKFTLTLDTELPAAEQHTFRILGRSLPGMPAFSDIRLLEPRVSKLIGRSYIVSPQDGQLLIRRSRDFQKMATITSN